MATAAAKGALSLIAETPEEQQYLENLKASRQALQDALLNRQQLFDPTLLAIAQGFLAPTKSGGFGESLANVAAQVGPVQEREQKQALEMAQIRAELAAQQVAEAQATRGEKQFRELIKGAVGQGEAPSEPGQPASAGAAQAAPGGMRQLNESDVLALSMAPGQKENAKTLLDLMKTQRDRFMISQNGIVFDRAAGKYLDLEIPGQKQEDFSTPFGTFKMTPNEYAQFSRANREGKGQEWIESFRRPGAAPGATRAPGAAPGAEPEAPGRMTVSESEARSAAAKEEAVGGAKSRAEQTAQARAAGKAAIGLLPIYDRMEVLLKAPGMDQIMGVLERGDVISALGSLVEEAVRVGNFSVGIPAVRKIVAQTGAPQDVIDRAAELGQLLAITQFEQRKGLGSGTSVSNFEQMMVNAMGPNMTDTLRSFGQKLNFLREKAKFDQELAAALRKSKMQYEDFEDTPEFKRLFGEYQRRVNGIVYPGQRPFTVQR